MSASRLVEAPNTLQCQSSYRGGVRIRWLVNSNVNVWIKSYSSHFILSASEAALAEQLTVLRYPDRSSAKPVIQVTET